MTILAQDNFDSDTAGSIAPGWINIGGTWVVRALNPVSGANAFGPTSDVDGNVSLYTALAARADMQVDTKQKLVSGSTAGCPAISHILRSDVAGANQYALVLSAPSASTYDLLLFKKISGTYSQITSQTGIACVRAVGDTLSLRSKIVGNTITAYLAVNGAAYGAASATFTDTSITAAGYPGLYYSKGGATGMTVDDFVYDDAAAAADTTPPTFVSALVANASPTLIQVTMSEALAASIPPTSAWTASGGRTVTNVAISGAVAQVTVNTPYVNGDTITIAYTMPGANPRLQDSATTPNITASFGPSAVTNNIGAVINNALTGATGSVLFSPYNWDIQASTAKTINAGAYLKFLFGGTVCTLSFDMTGLVAPLPQISYQVDRFSPWITVTVAASIAITMPSDTADYATKPGHLLELRVKSMTETQARWSTQATAVKLTGIILDAGKVISAPPALPLNAIFYGDSITEGVRTVNSTAANDTDRNDSGQAWSLEVGRILGAEVGNVGFGATGFSVSGTGSVPALPSSYNFLYSGVARSFTSSPDFIVLMEGTNDSADVTANATTVLNGLIAATTAKIIVLRPFGSAVHATQLQAAINACNTPSRCTYVDTAGFFSTANSSDGTHPYGVENITHIAPQVAAVIRPLLAGGTIAPTLTARTVTLSLTSGTDTAGNAIPAANLTGIKVSFFDQPTPDLHTVARFNAANETTDANGMMTFVAQSTLAVGGSGSATAMTADVSNFVVTVAVTA